MRLSVWCANDGWSGHLIGAEEILGILIGLQERRTLVFVILVVTAPTTCRAKRDATSHTGCPRCHTASARRLTARRHTAGTGPQGTATARSTGSPA
jgi:hypothetical protein